MKKTKCLISVVVTIGLLTLVQSCGSKRDTGRTYMPDMQYSRAYEAYAENDLAEQGINYVPKPVPGTIRRGDLFPYPLADDSTGYKLSASVQNPLPPLDSNQMIEAGRLFNINCAICHGAKMDAQGPLATGGKVPAVANLTLAQYVAMPEGTMFHSITYGKGNMGSYASQLTRRQRWMVIDYVKALQNGTLEPVTAPADSSATEEGADAATGSDSMTAK